MQDSTAPGRTRLEGSTPVGIGVLGSANMDIVVRVAAPPRPGETVFGESFVTVPGGKGLNQAVAAARAGGTVRFIGRVGGDVFGDEIVSLLDNEGISRTGLRRGHGATGTAHITVDGDGQNSIIVVSAANLAVSADQLTPDSMAGLGWLVTQLELPLQTVHQALRRARTAGIRTVLTPAPAMSVDNDVLKLVDLLVPNQFEASILSGLHDPRDAAAQLSRICGDVVVTLGEAGAVWARQGRIVASIPAQPVPVVDTTGAGDTFVGVLVAELAEGSEMPSALRLASVAASLSVGRNGATASMPSRAEIHHFA